MDYPENCPQPSGLTAEGASSASAYTSSVPLDDDWWAKSEDQTAELITSIQLIQSSEDKPLLILSSASSRSALL
jgi:hypothetical protein